MTFFLSETYVIRRRARRARLEGRKAPMLRKPRYYLARSAGKAPAYPVAQGFAHHQFEVAALQPVQLLSELLHAAPPGTGHPRDVGAPERPIRTDRVEDAVQVLVDAAERIGVFR